MKYLLRISFSCIVVLMVITLFGLNKDTIGWAKNANPPYEIPKTIYWGTRYVGASLYTIPATMAGKIGPALGSKIRLIPGTDVEMIMMLRSGKVHMATFAADLYWATMGLAQYSAFAFGPQPLRIIWPGLALSSPNTGLATKTSGIKTSYDLKGKRVGIVPGSAWSIEGVRGALAFANMTFDDVTVLEFASSSVLHRALVEGRVDFITTSVTAPPMYEAEVSPYGLYIVRYPMEDKGGWARHTKCIPYTFPGWTVKGPGLKPGEKVPTPFYPWPITNTLASQSDEFVYAICKAIHSKMDEIVAAYEPNEAMRVERAIIPEATIMAPFHPGAIRFFKEIGVWKRAHEEANKKRLVHLEKIEKRWEAFVEEAEERMRKTGKKVDPTKEWPMIVEKEIGVLP